MILDLTDKSFKIYDGGITQLVSWSSIFAQQRILICSAVRFNYAFTEHYIRDIRSNLEQYQQLGVDQIYLLAPYRFTFARLMERSENLPVLEDVDNFTDYLFKVVHGREADTKFTHKFWAYQALFNNGELEQISQQPVENYLATFLRDTKNIDLVRELGIKDDTLIWTPTYLSKTLEAAAKLLFYRLCPNTELKQYLTGTYQEIGK